MSSHSNRNKMILPTDSTEVVRPRKVLILLLLSFYNSIVAINHTLSTFQGYTPYYFCQVDNVSATVEGCVKQLNASLQTNEPSCPEGYQFKSERGDWTIVTEWQLVCERRYLRPMLATLYFCGVTIGAFVCGFLADRYGRRSILISCLYTQGLLGLCLYFTTSLQVFMAIRFVQGFFVQGLQGATFALLIELFPPKSRTVVAVVIDIYWPVGLMILTGASYCIPQWRPLQLLLSAPTAVTLFYVCLVPESPRWLVTHTKRIETTAILSKIVCAGQKMVQTDINSSKTVQLCNELDNNKELTSKLLEKNESIYKQQNNLTRENNDSTFNENITSCSSNASELQRKHDREITDLSSGSQNVVACITENTVNEDLINEKSENGEINQEINELAIQDSDFLSDNTKDNVLEIVYPKNSSRCDDPSYLWKEIISELGYDIEKALSDIQESCKNTNKIYSCDATSVHGSDNRNSIEVAGDDASALKTATSNAPSGETDQAVDVINFIAVSEVNQNLVVGNEELITDLDDIINQRDAAKSIITRDNKEKSREKIKQASILDLFRNDVLRKYNFIMVLVWFSVAISYYGIMFYLPGLSGERHLNFFLSALLELLSFILVYLVLSKCGRRLPMASFLFVTSFSCLTVGAISVIPEEEAPWIGHLQTALALLGKSGALACFCTMFLYTSELFPTVIRAVAMGHLGFWARVGSLISPQLIFLGENTLPAVPMIIIGVVGMISGISVFALPETLGQQLPDTVEEAELLAVAREKNQIKKLFT